MPLFFDTNVPVGYIFKWDPLHTYANKAFEIEDLKYWSKTVVNETDHKLKDISGKYIELLNSIYHELKNSEGFFNKKYLLTKAKSFKIKDLNLEKRMIIIESIWATEGFGYEEDSIKLSNSFYRIKMDLAHDLYSRKKNFSSNVQLHNRMKTYPKLERVLRKKIHPPDFDIFLDAHDLCSIHSDLEFITSDYNPENIEYVKSKTNIHKITDLKGLVF